MHSNRAVKTKETVWSQQLHSLTPLKIVSSIGLFFIKKYLQGKSLPPPFLFWVMIKLKRTTANSLAEEASVRQTQTDLVYTKYHGQNLKGNAP